MTRRELIGTIIRGSLIASLTDSKYPRRKNGHGAAI